MNDNGHFIEVNADPIDKDRPLDMYSPAVAFAWNVGDNTAQANAQLIAAAPTMYEALQAAEVMMRALRVSTPCTVSTNDSGKFRNINSFGVLKEVQEALAKATGRQAQL